MASEARGQGTALMIRGRESELAAVEQALWLEEGGHVVHLTEPPGVAAATLGLGGIGKTAIARAYVQQNRERYAGVWWLRGQSAGLVAADLTRQAKDLVAGIGGQANRTQAARTAVDAMTKAGGDKPWLVVVDGAMAAADVALLRARPGMHLVVTTRSSGWRGGAAGVPVDLLTAEASADIIQAGAPGSNRTEALAVAEDLGRLPLALNVAQATCRYAGLDLAGLREKLAEREAAVAGAAAVDLAIEAALARVPHAETVLGLAAHLAPERIALDLMAPGVISEKELDEAVSALEAVALVEREILPDGSQGLRMHRMVQAVARERAATHELFPLALRIVAQAYPDTPTEPGSWDACDKLEAHAEALLGNTPKGSEGAVPLSRLLNLHVAYLLARGDHASAERLLHHAIVLDEAAYGPEHLEIAGLLNNLAVVLLETDRVSDAEPLMRRAVHILERTLGPDHPQAKTVRANYTDVAAEVKALQDKLDAEEAARLGKYKAAHASPYPTAHVPVPEARPDERRRGLFGRLLGRK